MSNMDTQRNDLLTEHLAVLEGVGEVTLDRQFYTRLTLKMEQRAALKDIRGMRIAAVLVGVLVILLSFNLMWLDPDAGGQTSVSPDSVAGFAGYYDQQLSPDL